MNEIKQILITHKGGRPKKTIRQDQAIRIQCTMAEKILLQQKATARAKSLSEYLRETGLKGKYSRNNKVLPKEFLHFTGMLNHLAANLYQIAKKRNGFDELNALERADLNLLSTQVKQLAFDIKKNLL